MTLYSTKQFTVDSHGAYLTKLTDSSGNPILFEQKIIGDKRRGGSHICFPYFGVDAGGALPQHGFGRDVEWQVEVLSETQITCVYEKWEDDHFVGLSARLLYSLDGAGGSFHTSLLVSNKSSRNGQLATTPGFHPYFAVDPKDVWLNCEQIDLVDFEPYKNFPNTESMTIESGGQTITVWSQNLQHMIVWTDQKGDYLCVEPTHSGHSFDSAKQSGDLLQPSENKSYSYTISWR